MEEEKEKVALKKSAKSSTSVAKAKTGTAKTARTRKKTSAKSPKKESSGDVRPSQVIETLPEVPSEKKPEEPVPEQEPSVSVDKKAEPAAETEKKPEDGGEEKKPETDTKASETPVSDEKKDSEKPEEQDQGSSQKEGPASTEQKKETKPKKNRRILKFFKDSSAQNFMSPRGCVPLLGAIKYSLEDLTLIFLINVAVLAMIFSNLPFDGAAVSNDILIGIGQTSYKVNAIQTSLLLAGISTLLQIYPLWRFGAGLPAMMCSSIAFSGALGVIANYFYQTTGDALTAYGTVLASALVGGAAIFVLGFFSKWIFRIVKPIVSATVLFGLSIYLVNIGMQQFLSFNEVSALNQEMNNASFYDFSISWPFLIISGVSLLTVIVWFVFYKEKKGKEFGFLLALVVGFVAALIVDVIFPQYSIIDKSYYRFDTWTDYISLPHIFNPKYLHFDGGAIAFTLIVYIANATDTYGKTMATAKTTFGRPASSKEAGGALIVEGLTSVASVFGGRMPLSLSASNVYFVGRTMCVNRMVNTLSASVLILLSLFTPVSMFLATIPNAIFGGVLLFVYADLLLMSMKSLLRFLPSRKNTVIMIVTLGLGLGTSTLGAVFFNENTFPNNGWGNTLRFILETPMITMFIISFILSLAIRDRNETRESDLALHAEVSSERTGLNEKL